MRLCIYKKYIKLILMIKFSLKKYLTFLFLSYLLVVLITSKNETIQLHNNKLTCDLKITDDHIMDDLYYADLMNNFQDYGYNEWEYNINYDMEQGNILLDNEMHHKKFENEDESAIDLPKDNERSRLKKTFIDLIINEIDKHHVFYYQEFFDV